MLSVKHHLEYIHQENERCRYQCFSGSELYGVYRKTHGDQLSAKHNAGA